ncbi:3-dehydroquinate synthase [Pleomorphovibrio marinus]|uniref:3-dehydroquinate synthase n=1 Tax=Pleomorphovibrio marinus TaxID=2164132 RepID=UPI000E0A354C|nr:3-dehydroquinate synthase [Pleomorphovibrio marinus]
MEKIIFSTNIAQDLYRYLDTLKFSKIGVIADSETVRQCYPLIKPQLPSHELYTFPEGEINKNLDTCTAIWKWMTECSFDRKAIIINIGGGVTGDMGGFCASTYKRGIRFINLPTTLLSQVDASVGGKLGVDFMGFKNHIGVFTTPEAVLISDQFLKTLPKSELRSGYAEVIKHGLIANANYFEGLKRQHWTDQNWKDIIEVSVGIKKNVVSKDPKEEGLRKILNFGHTIGHAVESFYLNSTRHLLHGEAIAIGMLAEGYLSNKYLRMPPHDLKKIEEMILAVFEKPPVQEQDFEEIANLCFQDKKNDGRILNFSLLPRIGSCEYNIAVGKEDILQSLRYYNELQP